MTRILKTICSIILVIFAGKAGAEEAMRSER